MEEINEIYNMDQLEQIQAKFIQKLIVRNHRMKRQKIPERDQVS